MYVVRTRSLGDNLSTLGLASSAKSVVKSAPREMAGFEGAKDRSKADEAPTDAYKRFAGSAPVVKGCLAALETLKKPKLSAREKKLAELDNFYGAAAKKTPSSPAVVKNGFDLDDASDNAF